MDPKKIIGLIAGTTVCAGSLYYLFTSKEEEEKKETHNNKTLPNNNYQLSFCYPLLSFSKKNKLPRPIVLNGPSGCGKSTLTNQLMKRFPDLFAFSISHTTRSPRKGEVNGVDYHFISKEQFKQDIEDNKFVEYAEVHGNFYGTSIQSIKDVREKGQIPILDINLDGGQSVVKAKLNPILIFVNAPSWEILERRLTNRGTETKEQIKRRLETAKEEIEWVKNNPKFHHLHLINNLLEDAVDELQETVQSEIDLVTKN